MRWSEQVSEVEFAVHYNDKEISNESSYEVLPFFPVIQRYNYLKWSEQESDVKFAVHYKGKEISNGSSYESLPNLPQNNW